MCLSCTMTASSITPPAEEEERAEVDGVKWAERVVVLVRGRFNRNWASLRRTNAALIAHMMVK